MLIVLTCRIFVQNFVQKLVLTIFLPNTGEILQICKINKPFSDFSCTSGHELAVVGLQKLHLALFSAKFVLCNGLAMHKKVLFCQPSAWVEDKRTFVSLFGLFLSKIRPKFAEFD